MKTAFFVACISLAAAVACPFRHATAQNTSAESLPAATTTVSLEKYAPRKELQEFGTRSEGSIRVRVYYAVKQPGIYYLSSGAVVRDAIQMAGGMTEFASLNSSCLLRPIDNEKAEVVVKFPRKTRETALETPLEEGDRVVLIEAEGW